MSINSIHGPTRLPATPSDMSGSAAAAAAASARSGAANASASAESLDQVTQQPLPPRFPWLSRLSAQLESASKQRAAFAPAPILGDHVDRSV